MAVLLAAMTASDGREKVVDHRVEPGEDD